MAIKLEVSWGGGRDNDDGFAWLKFIAPFDQAAQFSRCILLTHKQCWLLCKWNGIPQRIGIAMYNGKTETPDGEARISFKSDNESLDHDLLAQLKKAVVGKKTFELLILTSEEAQKLQQEGKLQSDVSEEELSVEEPTESTV